MVCVLKSNYRNHIPTVYKMQDKDQPDRWSSSTNQTRCLKITEKVSFNIASEASYIYILSGKKLIKNAKNGPIWRVFEKLKLAVNHS